MKNIRWIKAVVLVALLVPLGLLAWRGYNTSQGLTPDLGANPLEFITHNTGDWTIRLVMITLAVTPVRKLLKQPWLIQLRKMFGLFAFFYGTLHLFTYLWFDKQFDFHEMFVHIVKRRFITMGMLAFALMIPLALTSTTWAIRKLGGKRWQALHRLIYVTGMAAVVHYIWLVKADLRYPLMYAGILAVLLGYRVVEWARKRASSARKSTAEPAAVGR